MGSRAARALGLSDTEAEDDGEVTSSSDDPPGCYYSAATLGEPRTLMFNSGMNTGMCSDEDECLCIAPEDDESSSADMEALIEEEVLYTNMNEEEMVGYVIYQAEGEVFRPGLMMFPGPWGDGGGMYEREAAREYARKGMVVFLPDYYTGRHSEDVYADVQYVFSQGEDYHKNTELAQSTAMAGYEQLKNMPMVDSTSISAIGFCWGGANALHLARAGGDLTVAVSLHGEYPDYGTGQSAPWNVDYFSEIVGADDPIINADDRENWITELKAETSNSDEHSFEFIAFGKTVHAFSIYYSETVYQFITDTYNSDQIMVYDEMRAQQSFGRIDELFQQYHVLDDPELVSGFVITEGGTCQQLSACSDYMDVMFSLEDQVYSEGTCRGVGFNTYCGEMEVPEVDMMCENEGIEQTYTSYAPLCDPYLPTTTISKPQIVEGSVQLCQESTITDCAFLYDTWMADGWLEGTCASQGISVACPDETMSFMTDCAPGVQDMDTTQMLTMEWYATDANICDMIDMNTSDDDYSSADLVSMTVYKIDPEINEHCTELETCAGYIDDLLLIDSDLASGTCMEAGYDTFCTVEPMPNNCEDDGSISTYTNTPYMCDPTMEPTSVYRMQGPICEDVTFTDCAYAYETAKSTEGFMDGTCAEQSVTVYCETVVIAETSCAPLADQTEIAIMADRYAVDLEQCEAWEEESSSDEDDTSSDEDDGKPVEPGSTVDPTDPCDADVVPVSGVESTRVLPNGNYVAGAYVFVPRRNSFDITLIDSDTLEVSTFCTVPHVQCLGVAPAENGDVYAACQNTDGDQYIALCGADGSYIRSVEVSDADGLNDLAVSDDYVFVTDSSMDWMTYTSLGNPKLVRYSRNDDTLYYESLADTVGNPNGITISASGDSVVVPGMFTPAIVEFDFEMRVIKQESMGYEASGGFYTDGIVWSSAMLKYVLGNGDGVATLQADLSGFQFIFNKPCAAIGYDNTKRAVLCPVIQESTITIMPDCYVEPTAEPTMMTCDCDGFPQDSQDGDTLCAFVSSDGRVNCGPIPSSGVCSTSAAYSCTLQITMEPTTQAPTTEAPTAEVPTTPAPTECVDAESVTFPVPEQFGGGERTMTCPDIVITLGTMGMTCQTADTDQENVAALLEACPVSCGICATDTDEPTTAEPTTKEPTTAQPTLTDQPTVEPVAAKKVRTVLKYSNLSEQTFNDNINHFKDAVAAPLANKGVKREHVSMQVQNTGSRRRLQDELEVQTDIETSDPDGVAAGVAEDGYLDDVNQNIADSGVEALASVSATSITEPETIDATTPSPTPAPVDDGALSEGDSDGDDDSVMLVIIVAVGVVVVCCCIACVGMFACKDGESKEAKRDPTVQMENFELGTSYGDEGKRGPASSRAQLENEELETYGGAALMEEEGTPDTRTDIL